MSARTALVCAFLSAALFGAVPALAASSGEVEAGRDQVRRIILDVCVYGQSGKEGMKQDVIVDRCQCASNRVMKGLKAEEIAAAAEAKDVPGAWNTAAEEAFAGCGKR
jgi:hypothetical protein